MADKEKKGMPITIKELIGHYEMGFMKPEQFEQLLMDFIKQESEKGLDTIVLTDNPPKEWQIF